MTEKFPLRERWKHMKLAPYSLKKRRAQIYNFATCRAKGIAHQVGAMRTDLEYQSLRTQILIKEIETRAFALTQSIKDDQQELIKRGE